MPELNCVLILKGKDGTLGLYYPFTKWRNILDAPDVTGIEVLLNGHIGNSDIQAEKQFGSGTGSLKYAAVADWIYQRIPAVLKLLFTSSDIEKMIEDVLEEAKKAWGANENLKGYIEAPSVENLLVGIEAQAVQTEPAEN